MTRPVTAFGFAAAGLVLVAVTAPVAASGRVGDPGRWVFAGAPQAREEAPS